MHLSPSAVERRVSQLVDDGSMDTTLPPGNRPDVWRLHEKAYRLVFQALEPIDYFATSSSDRTPRACASGAGADGHPWGSETIRSIND